jgi:hypothetical protein
VHIIMGILQGTWSQRRFTLLERVSVTGIGREVCGSEGHLCPPLGSTTPGFCTRRTLARPYTRSRSRKPRQHTSPCMYQSFEPVCGPDRDRDRSGMDPGTGGPRGIPNVEKGYSVYGACKKWKTGPFSQFWCHHGALFPHYQNPPCKKRSFLVARKSNIWPMYREHEKNSLKKRNFLETYSDTPVNRVCDILLIVDKKSWRDSRTFPKEREINSK